MYSLVDNSIHTILSTKFVSQRSQGFHF